MEAFFQPYMCFSLTLTLSQSGLLQIVDNNPAILSHHIVTLITGHSRPQPVAFRPPLGIPDNTTDTGHRQRRPALPAIKNSHSQLVVRLWHPQRCTTITLLDIYRPHHRYCLNEKTTIVSIFSCLEVRQGKERESLTLAIILPHPTSKP